MENKNSYKLAYFNDFEVPFEAVKLPCRSAFHKLDHAGDGGVGGGGDAVLLA